MLREDLSGYEASLSAAALHEHLIREDAVRRWAGEPAEFHYAEAEKAFSRLAERMAALRSAYTNRSLDAA